MAKTTTIEGLADAIAQELSLYQKEVQERVNLASEQAAAELVKITKKTAPVDANAKKGRRGKFRRAIAYKETRSLLGDKEYTWYVKAPEHRLTHLLVHGHATKDGDRTPSDPFLQNALDRVLLEYEKAVEEAVKGD